VLASFAATGFLVAGIHAWLLLRDRNSLFHQQALSIALLCGGIAGLLQPISGDLLAKAVAREQPAKLAVMEALFQSTAAAPFRLGGLPNLETQEVPYGIDIPYALSVLLYMDAKAVVSGLDTIPRELWPPVATVHLAFQVMVGVGLVLSGLAIWSGWRWWKLRSFHASHRLLRALVIAAPLGFVAIEAGWVVTEVGRQPWIIYQVMRTSEAVTSMPGLWIPMALFTTLYLLLAGVVVWVLGRHIAAMNSL
jgi:cytochrome d ubiquinol oxidase subunit I